MRARSSQRLAWAAVVATFVFLLAIILVVMRGGQVAAADGVTTDTGGRVALVALVIAAVLPAFIRSIDVRTPRWLPWAVGGVSFGVIVVLAVLRYTGQDSLAWAAYGGLQVLRGREFFSDLDWYIRWLDCDYCTRWDPHIGPSLEWLDTASGHSITLGWVPLAGFVLAMLLVLSLVWLVRISNGRGALVLLIAAVGPAWLLLVERANFDAIAFLAIMFGAWLVRRHESLLTWSVFALVIWVAGTTKYYPFAIGLALLPALRLRRGWTVVTGFAVASLTFAAAYWGDFADSRAMNERIQILWDFPAYGRNMILDRMGPWGADLQLFSLGNALFLGLAVVTTLWGVLWARHLRTRSIVHPVLALGGSSVFLASILVGGFGFMYKGAFLLPLVPLLALPWRSAGHDRIVLYTSLFALVLTGYALTAAYASVLTTLSGITVACIALGAGLELTWRRIRSREAPRPATSVGTEAVAQVGTT